MKKLFLLFLLFSAFNATAQIEIIGLLGRKPDSRYLPGFGAMLKFAVPVGEADDVSFEIAAKIIPEIEYPDSYGIIYLPLKVGYRYTLDRSGTGWYLEPQVGYNLTGVRSYQSDGGIDTDEKFKGVVSGAAFGYLFERKKIIQYDLSLRFESVVYSGGSVNTIGIRLTHNFSFRRRDY